jgi:hypothetical protein
LHRTTEAELAMWAGSSKRVVALIPEHDDYLQPAEAAQRFATIPHTELVPVDGAKHLWVGETATKTVLNEIVRAVRPQSYPLPEVFETA